MTHDHSEHSAETITAAKAARAATNSLPYLLYGLLFCSGATALIYEVGWVRMLALAVGSTTQSASCVIAAFLGGLALGAFLAGKLVDKWKHSQLVLYGLIELSIAIVAPGISFALEKAPLIFAALSRMFPSNALCFTLERLALASVLLLLPTILMGATLPVVVNLLAKTYARPAHYFSMLYGLNTLGAAAGSLIAAFFAFPYLGVLGSIMLAGGINLVVGCVAVCSYRLVRVGSASTSDIVEKSAEPSDTVAFSWRWLSIVAAFLGFTALSYEVLWIRLLHAFIASSTYAFTAMVSTFLIGLVVGSVIYNRTLNRDEKFIANLNQQLGMLAVSQYGAALASVLGLIILPGIIILRAAFFGLGGDKFAVWLQVEFLISFLMMIVPAAFIGLSFPVIAGLAATINKSTAAAVGNIYAFNTLGCILGSVVCGLILIPSLGSQYTMEAIAIFTVMIALVIDYKNLPRRWLRMVFLGVPVFLSLLLPYQYLEKSHARLMNANFLAAAEDAIGRCLFVSSDTGKRLFVNGTSYSTDTMPSMRYMTALAYYPILLHPAPQEVLVVCFGIGTTAGAVTRYPGLVNLDICEISPAVLSGAHLFTATNYGVTKNPKVNIILEDGRNYLLRSDKKYDIISFEPPPPTDAGINSLYSSEFYKLCLEHLNTGGILSQWLPMHTESATLWKMMTRTPGDVFSHVTVWQPDGLEAIALASDQPFKFDFASMQKRIDSSKDIKQCLDRVGLTDPYQIMATYVLGGDEYSKVLNGFKSVTDDRSNLEFFLPYAGVPLYPLELEAVKSDVKGLCRSQNPNIDMPQLEKNLEVMRLVREAITIRWKTDTLDRAEQLYKQALQILPDNKYIQWMVQHPGVR